MKGRMSNICRANGGSTGMRDIAGYKAPSYGTDKSVLKAAEGKTVGMIPDGESSKGRLDRPGRKHGGKVMHEGKKKDHKADGGGVTSYMAGKALDKAIDTGIDGGIAGGAGLVAATDPEIVSKGLAGTIALGKGAQAAKEYGEFKNFRDSMSKWNKTGLPDKPKGDDSDNGRKNGGRAPMNLDLKKGALHKELGVSGDKKIPEKKLEKAAHGTRF